MLVALIMAGGSGERFWPLSTPTKPKQLLSLFSDNSMIRETVNRILPIISPDKIFVATNILQYEELKKELYDIPESNIIVEPIFKDTAAAIGYSCLIIEEKLKKIQKDIEVVVLASDHLIKENEKFRKIILNGVEKAKENKTIITLGIKPTTPETGYGYIEVIDTGANLKLNELYKVRRFREKPNKETAEKYLLSNRYLWNSGIFIFTIETIFKNFKIFMPEHTEIFNKIKKELDKKELNFKSNKLIKDYFNEFEKISIDFGIMEHSKNIEVIPVSIGWNDVGSFIALEDIFEADASKNIVKNTKTIIYESTNNIVLVDDCMVSLLGVKDLIIVKNGSNILISHKDKAQDIKKIVEDYKKRNEYEKSQNIDMLSYK